MKIETKHVSFKDYISLSYEDRKEIDFNLTYGQFSPLDLFQVGSFVDLPFGIVKDIQEIFATTGLTWHKFIEQAAIIKNTTQPIIAERSIYKLHSCRLYFREQIETINKLESELAYSGTGKEEAAGIDVFEKFRSFIQFDKLAGGDVTKIEAVRNVQYGTCFAKLLLDKETVEYEKRLMKLYNK